MGPTAEIIRIVLVSPNDVEAEWRYARKAIDEVDAYNAKPRGHRLELYTWKTDAYPGWHLEGPQGLIDALLPIETCDLVIGIFWKRMGTLTPEGTTGTEHEILKAYKASKNQGGHPQLMVYFSSASFSPKSKEEIDQWGRVLDFKTTLEKAKILLWSYKKKEFEADLRKHLSTYLNHRIGGTPVQPVETSKEARTETSRDRALTRSTIPSVTVGTEVKAGSASSVAFSPQASLKPEKVSRGDLMIVTNTRLESPGRNDTASHVGVPSVAMNGRVVFYTGNWYAALSQDGGHEFSYIDPNLLAQPDDQKYSRSFCCNQVVTYLPSIDTFVWLLQYGPSTGNNIHRVAFAKTEEVLRNQWRLFDISPQMLGVPDAYLSFPDLAAGANFLYVTTNIFIDISAGEVGAAVLRIPFSSIAKGEPSLERFVSTKLFSFRVAQNCRETAYFAAHQDTSTLTIFSWPESEDAPSERSVPIARWVGGSGYHSRCPDGRTWLDRADPRLTGATMAGSELWFAWPVDKGPNQRPNPHVQVARINSWDMNVIENITVWDTESAICYPSLCTNADNDVTISYMIGGGPRFPSHVAGTLTSPRKNILVAEGKRGPVPDPKTGSGMWGDYLTVRPVFPEAKLFVAAGYTLQGKEDKTPSDATPNMTVFGRSEGPGLPSTITKSGPVVRRVSRKPKN